MVSDLSRVRVHLSDYETKSTTLFMSNVLPDFFFSSSRGITWKSIHNKNHQRQEKHTSLSVSCDSCILLLLLWWTSTSPSDLFFYDRSLISLSFWCLFLYCVVNNSPLMLEQETQKQVKDKLFPPPHLHSSPVSGQITWSDHRSLNPTLSSASDTGVFSLILIIILLSIPSSCLAGFSCLSYCDCFYKSNKLVADCGAKGLQFLPQVS